MSTSVDVVVCPYCKQHTLMRELNCDSLEDNWFCTSCGFVREFKFLKDDKDQLVRFDQWVSRKRLFFVVVDEMTAKVVWKEPIPSAINSSEAVFRFLRNKKYDAEYFDILVPEGIRFIAYQDDSKSLTVLSNGFDIVIPDYRDKWYIDANVMDLGSNDSTGLIFCERDGFISAYPFKQGTTKEQALIMAKEYFSKISNYDKEKSYATWFNTKTNKLEYLIFD